MEALFLRVLNMSVTAGYLVVAVLVFRLLLRRAPKWISCMLWGLVGLRLALPISVQSALSLIPSSQPVPLEALLLQAPAASGGVGFAAQAVAPPFSATAANYAASPAAPVAGVASAIWLCGLACMLLYAAASYIRLQKSVSAAVLLQGNMFECESVSCPFVLGIFRPRIYLPFNMDAGELAHVTAHERAHIKRRDHVAKPFGFLLLSVYWFNPLMWLAYALLCRDIEAACDERVIKELSPAERRSYSAALLNLSISRKAITACPLAFGETNVKQRIKDILNYKKPAFWVIAAAMLACIALAVCFLTDPKETTAGDAALPAQEAAPIEENSEALVADAFVSNKCIYLSPLSSALPTDDNGRRYLVGQSSFTVTNGSTGEILSAVSPLEWNWAEMSGETWSALFPMGVGAPDISAYEKPLMLALYNGYYLFNMDGELWVGEYSGDAIGMWSVYSLAPVKGAAASTTGGAFGPTNVFVAPEVSTPSTIESVQQQLAAAGYLEEGYAQGSYDEPTAATVKRFQADAGLPADGLIGDATLSALSGLRPTPLPNMLYNIAADQTGKPYQFGASGPDAFDSSGLVYYALSQSGLDTERLTAQGYSEMEGWTRIDEMSALEKGDLVFFHTERDEKVNHCGICSGGLEMIHASSSNGKVLQSPIHNTYWTKHFSFALRAQ